jgi:hypothetical protein
LFVSTADTDQSCTGGLEITLVCSLLMEQVKKLELDEEDVSSTWIDSQGGIEMPGSSRQKFSVGRGHWSRRSRAIVPPRINQHRMQLSR